MYAVRSRKTPTRHNHLFMNINNEELITEWLQEGLNRVLTHEQQMQVIWLFEQAKDMERDKKEITIIKKCAEESTKEASSNSDAYANGYTQGYKRALELVEWKIQNELRNQEQ